MKWKPFNVRSVRVGDLVTLEVRLADQREGNVSYTGVVEDIRPESIHLLQHDGVYLIERSRIQRMK